MKVNVLIWVGVLLSGFLNLSANCRPVDATTSHVLPRPLLRPLVEEFSLRLGGGGASSSFFYQALLQLTQRLLQLEHHQQKEKDKRSDDSPISLDLTFHLLREVLEMARAEQIAQQANSNRKIMDTFGKRNK